MRKPAERAILIGERLVPKRRPHLDAGELNLTSLDVKDYRLEK